MVLLVVHTFTYTDSYLWLANNMKQSEEMIVDGVVAALFACVVGGGGMDLVKCSLDLWRRGK